MTLDSYSFPAVYAYLVDSRPDITFINLRTCKEYDIHRWGIPDGSDISDNEWNTIINSVSDERSIFYIESPPSEVNQMLKNGAQLLYDDTELELKDVYRVYLIRG